MRPQFLNQHMIGIGLTCFVLTLGAAQGQTTLTGYRNTASLPNYNADSAYALLDEWMGLINPNLDALPSARETEIYQELVRGERGTSEISSFDWDNKFADDGMYVWGSSGAVYVSLKRIELAKDLAWLPTALDHADEMLALRDPVGTYSPNHGRNLLEPLWLSPHLSDAGEISPLNSGRNGAYIARFANWILEHPELYPQTAPANPVIPLTVPTTYYGRAKFYLTELKKMIEEEDQAGFFWEFDTTNHVGWVFQNGALDGSDLSALYPSGVSATNIQSISSAEGISLHPYNRTLYFMAARLETAKGLQLIDGYESTSAHTTFINTATNQSTQALNYWRYHRATHVEAGPAGTSHTWPYGGSQDSSVKYEDSVHFAMDVDPMKSFREAGLLSGYDLEGVTGSLYSRWFDHESHVYFQHQGRSLYTHAVTGLPKNAYWWWGLGLSDWMGEFATPAQTQGSAMKSLEVFRERMRRASFDLSFREQYLGRDDTRRGRNMKGPFQLYDLKMARHARGLTPSAGSNAPVIQSVSPLASFSVSEGTALGTVIGAVSATDADAGQSLHYWISGGNIGNRFKIDPVSGIIRVNNYYALNDEEGALTPLEITVMDDGVPVRMATTTVNISLDDTNTSPLFPAGQTGRFTPNLIKGDPVMVVNASDASDLGFFIETGTTLFSIDADSGIIRIKDSAVAANCSAGSTYTLQIGVIEKSTLPLTTFETVEITCEAPFGNATASVSSGTVPFSVDFNSTQSGGGTVVSTAWDFGDGGSAGTPSASHTYTMAGTNVVHALILDERGEIDRQTLQVTAQGSGGTIPEGLLAHYRFSESAGTTALDSSGNFNHATLSADAYDADGRIGTGLELRDEILTIPSSIYSVLSDEITISFFLRGDDDFHPYNTVCKAVDAGGNRVVSTHLPWGGEGGNYIWDAGNSGTSFDRVLTTPPIPAAGEWNHWVFTKNASSGAMAMYTNGVLLASGSGKTKSMSGITGFQFGGNNYKGTIDEIRIYDQALNATEVTDLHNAMLADFPAGSGTGGLRRDRWNNISGSALNDLTSLGSYPNAADVNDVLTTIDYTMLGDDYGILLRGYLHAPITGDYTFYVASDDASELRISSDRDPVNAVALVGVTGWVSRYNYTTSAQMVSLVAGQQYYIEVLHKEGGGGDHLAVAWSAPGYKQVIIDGQYLSPFLPDSDGDGLTDAQETALGTDPNDPDSGFGIDGDPHPTLGKMQITWPSSTSVLYRVWKSPDLVNWSVARDWTNALSPPEDVLQFDLSPTNGFFKVEAEIQ